MITLTEKRLQYFESQVQTLLQRLDDMDKSLLRCDALKNDLEAVSLRLVDLTAQQAEQVKIANLRQYNSENDHAMFNAMLDGHTRALKSFVEREDKLEAQVATLNDQILELKRKTNDLSNLNTGHSDRLQALEVEDSKNASIFMRQLSLNRTYNESFTSLEERADSTSTVLANHMKYIEENENRIVETIGLLSSYADKIERRITAEISPLQNNQISNPRIDDIESQLAEVKKDLETVLSVIHEVTKQNPEQEKLNAKIKSMETNLAQVYGLLKKYETR